jgi:hypothetical protein
MVSRQSPHLLRHHPGSPLVPAGNTSSTTGHHQAVGDHATVRALCVVTTRNTPHDAGTAE